MEIIEGNETGEATNHETATVHEANGALAVARRYERVVRLGTLMAELADGRVGWIVGERRVTGRRGQCTLHGHARGDAQWPIGMRVQMVIG